MVGPPIPLQASHHLIDTDFLWWQPQLEAPSRASQALEIPRLPQAGEHLLEVALGDFVPTGDLMGLQQLTAPAGLSQIHQGDQAVIRLGTEHHGLPMHSLDRIKRFLDRKPSSCVISGTGMLHTSL